MRFAPLKHINSYTKGMNKDLSLNLFPADAYQDAELMTPVSNEPNSVGKMVNIKGNVRKFTGMASGTVIGKGSIRNKIILVLTTSGGDTYIYTVTDDGTINSQAVTLFYTDSVKATKDKLGYTQSTKLSIVTRYENEDIQKVYMAAEGFPLRYFNLEDSNISGTTAQDYFNIIPSVSLSKPYFDAYTSGNKVAGKVCYSYQLFKTFGNETSFSQTSELISVSASIKATEVENLYGQEPEGTTGVGVQFQIDNLDTSFDRIRVLAFNYVDFNSNPTVNIIYEGSFSDSSITLIDDGTSLGTYDLSTFRTLNSFIPKPADIVSKNNILFPVNLTEEYFDIDNYLNNSDLAYNTGILTTDAGGSGKKFWDSRVYRFISSGVTYLYDAQGTSLEYTLSGASPNYDSIPYNAACVNKYNLVSNNGTYYPNGAASEDSPTIYVGEGSSSTLGGSGKNFKFEIGIGVDNLDDSYSHYRREGATQDLHRGLKPSFQMDEVYRFYIQFENYLGQKSYPKWMLDARMPNMLYSTYGDPVSLNYGSYTQVNSLYPNFKIRNCPQNPDGTYMRWRILRVKREGLNRTIIGTGIVSATLALWGSGATEIDAIGPQEPINGEAYRTGSYVFPDGTTRGDGIDKTILQLISPELTMGDIDISNFELHHMGYMKCPNEDEYYYRYSTNANWRNYGNDNVNLNQSKIQISRKITDLDDAPYQTSSGRIRTINAWKKVSPNKDVADEDSANFSVGGHTYRHIHQSNSTLFGFGCTMHILEIPTAFSDISPGPGSTTSYMFVAIKNPGIPYGGNSYEAKLRNISVPASDFAAGSSGLSAWNGCYKGDVVWSYFEYMRTQVHPDRTDNVFQEVLHLPVESEYNFNLMTNEGFNSISSGTFANTWRLREDGLVDLDDGIELPKLYQYNPVYSRWDDTEQYIPIQDDTVDSNLYDHRIRRSEIKYNGEYSDSWLKYLPNNYIDVDSQYGPINTIKVFKDKLMYFQDTGFGTVPVGEKELIPSQGQSTLSLGSSGILDRYDYISDTIGCTDKNSVVISPDALYLYDNIKKTFHKVTGQPQNLSDVEGMNSYIDENVSIDDVIWSGYNPIMKEIIYRLGSNILVYSELNNSFSYRYPTGIISAASPYQFFNHKNDFYMIGEASNGTKYVFKSNYGDRGSLFERSYPSTITLVVNPKGVVVNIYDVIEMLTEVYDTNGDEIPDETFTSIQIWNEYQDSGVITLTEGSNIRKRFRTWKFNTIRVDSGVDANQPKIRSPHINIKLSFTNSTNKKILLDNLITNYIPSKMMY